MRRVFSTAGVTLEEGLRRKAQAVAIQHAEREGVRLHDRQLLFADEDLKRVTAVGLYDFKAPGAHKRGGA